MGKETEKTVVYSALEVANICGVVNQTAINWIRNGHLTAFSTPGGQYRVYQEDLVAFMKKRNMRIPENIQKADTTRKTVVLVVDDDKGLNNVLTKYLIKNFPEYEVYQAFDGFEAGAQIAEKKPGVIFLDLDLPGVDGFSLCEKIKKGDAFGNPKVFVITALKDDDVEERVKALGAEEFFQKPLTLPEASAAIKKYVEC